MQINRKMKRKEEEKFLFEIWEVFCFASLACCLPIKEEQKNLVTCNEDE